MREPAPPYANEGPFALWHVSEDAGIAEFRPHRAATALGDEEVVWAIDTRHLPMYWFPRDCPRGTFWARAGTSDEDVERFLDGDRSRRVHALQSDWLGCFREVRLVAYRLPEAVFAPHDVGGYWIAHEPVRPLELLEIGDLLARHAAAQIELRVVPGLARLWERVTGSTLEFSGVRLHNLVQ